MMKRGAEINGGKKKQETSGKITVQLEEITRKYWPKKED